MTFPQFAGSRSRASCYPGAHHPFLAVGNQGGEETELNIKKPVEINGRSWPWLGFLALKDF